MKKIRPAFLLTLILVLVLGISLGMYLKPNHPTNSVQKVVVEQVVKKPTIADLTAYIEERNPRIRPELSNRIAKAIVEYSEKNGLKLHLVCSVIENESNWRPNAVSKSKRDIGLMQINIVSNEKLLKEKGLTKLDCYNVENNIMLGCEILKNNMKHFGDVQLALSGYNAGITRTINSGLHSKDYVRKVLATYYNLNTDYTM